MRLPLKFQQEIVDYLGMQPCDGSDQVPPKKTKHALYLAGTFITGSKVRLLCLFVRLILVLLL
jgi:hypothetical protein